MFSLLVLVLAYTFLSTRRRKSKNERVPNEHGTQQYLGNEAKQEPTSFSSNGVETVESNNQDCKENGTEPSCKSTLNASTLSSNACTDGDVSEINENLINKNPRHEPTIGTPREHNSAHDDGTQNEQDDTTVRCDIGGSLVFVCRIA